MGRQWDNVQMIGSVSTTLEWFEIWLAAFGNDHSGIWKFESENCSVRIPYHCYRNEIASLGIPTVGGATNDHTPRFDLIGNPSGLNSIFDKLFRDLSVSLAVFPYLSKNSLLLCAFNKESCAWKYLIDDCEQSPFVDCTMDWDSYWKSRGKTRQTWSRREKKLIQKLGARFHVLSTPEEVKQRIEEIFEVEASGWKGQKGSAMKQKSNTRQFYFDLIQSFSEKGWLRVFTMELGGKIIAFQITTLFNKRIFMHKIGYLTEYAKYSPGQALQLQILRWAFREPEVEKFDLLGGGGEAFETKLKWATGVENLYTLYVFKRNFYGLIAWFRFVLAPKIKKVLLG